jgi:hypothetical protein
MAVPPSALFPESTRAVPLTLAASPDGQTPVAAGFTSGPRPQAAMEWNRMITARSSAGLPFDMRVEWINGFGLGGLIKVTAVGGVARLIVSATAVQITVANWAQKENKIVVGISDCDAPLSAQELALAMRKTSFAIGGSITVSVPPFALSLVAKASNNAQLANVELDFQDDTGATVFKCAANATDIRPGSASQLVVTNNDPAIINSLQLIWALAL